MNNIDIIKNWTHKTWTNSQNQDQNLQAAGKQAIKNLSASERQLLLLIIHDQKKQDDPAVIALKTKLASIDQPGYVSTRPKWFWSSLARKWKNRSGRISSILALNALNLFYTAAPKSALSLSDSSNSVDDIKNFRKLNAAEKKEDINNILKFSSPDRLEAKKELDSCVNKFHIYSACHPMNQHEYTSMIESIIEKYKEIYNIRYKGGEAQERFEDAFKFYTRGQSSLCYARKFPID